MANVRGKIFCQRCKTGNELGQDLCARCGTRLMLMVETSSARFEDRSSAGGMEEHLLERVTAIENNISRLIDKLEQMAELMLKGSRSAYFDHALLETLLTVLTESGIIDRRKLEAAWRERANGDEGLEGSKRRRRELCEKIVEVYRGEGREEFARLVGEGVEEHSKGREAKGVRVLERAAEASGGNLPLDIFLGEHFFRAGRAARARKYLSRAQEADPENAMLRLMLGLACADAGDAARAREVLRDTLKSLGPTFAAHCALGLLSASESDWKGASSEFRRALAAREYPEAHYLVGLAQFNAGRFAAARASLKRAVKLDDGYGAAFYLLGLAHAKLGEAERAARAFSAAAAADPREPLYRAAKRRRAGASRLAPPPLFDKGGRGGRGLLTGGDARLAALLYADALSQAKRR
ncbi:MAG TPA: tetratricopeptide repeat protein [Pyrinomonadaceae bacterium]|jgi:Flp pilus assembly protein TadD|nr:tetratricopeptide repeat protein [Pyrinomonadaceae bacterium]